MFEWINKIKNKIEKYKIKTSEQKNLNNINKTKIEKDEDNEEYENLMPKDNLEINSIEALDYAFKNKKVKNIAITGNYSSGKSSLIQSYVNKRISNRKKKQINTISLATFQSNVEDVSVEELEKYIIEQLYYSTYKRNLNRNMRISWVLSVFLYLLFISISMLIKWDILYFYFLQKYLKLEIAGIFIIASISIICILKNILKYIYKIDKFNLSIMDLKLEIKNEGTSNIINENIELILKIFNKFRYKYIIFEDIDRFNKSIIFEHLRELNNVLNKNLNVKFLYLIRDDVFKEENRTKFFDYIYSVVPYVSYSTSGEELNKLIKERKLDKELPKEFITKLTVFVQDMRILKNTLNEYRIYKAELNSDAIEYKNLFSILLYKNIYPDDFSNLQRLNGNLFNMLNKKVEKLKEIDDEIKYKESILENNEVLSTDKEIFCRAAERKITQLNSSNKDKIILKNEKRGNAILDNSVKLSFDYLTDINTQIPEYMAYTQYISAPKYWKENDSKLYVMLNKIKMEEQNAKEKMHQELRDLKEKRESIESYNLSALIKNNIITDNELDIFDINSSNTGNIRKCELVKYLLQEGYINENYSRYITKFHSGSLTKEDNDFVGNCMINRKNDFMEKLENVQKIINDLDEEYFKSESILNLTLLKKLMWISGEKLNNFINTLLNSNNFSSMLDKIHLNLKEDEYNQLFKCFGENKNSFQVINNKINDEDIKNNYIRNLLLQSSSENINNFCEFEELKKYIEEKSIFLDDNNDSKIIDIIELLDIKYINLDKGYESNSYIFEYCIENGRYVINNNNIKNIIKHILNSDETTIERDMKRNYSIIRNDAQICSYIDDNINEYIKNVYLHMGDANNDADTIVNLLNNSNISYDDKEKIIELESDTDIDKKFKIKKLSQVNDTSSYNKLFERDLIECSYENIAVFYEKKINIEPENEPEVEDDSQENVKVSQDIEYSKKVLLEYLNRNGLLLKNKINEFSTSKFFCYICLEDRLNDNVYEIVIPSFKRIILNLDIDKVSIKKQEILINNNIIKLNSDMYNRIRKTSTSIFVLFTYNNREEIGKDIKNYLFNSTEIVSIIENNKFHWTFKEKVIQNLSNYENYGFKESNANKIINYILQRKIAVNLSQEQIIDLVSCSNDNLVKIRFINEYFNKLNRENIEEILTKDLTEYLPLILDKKKPKYEYNVELEIFIENLKKLNYNIRYEVKENIIKISPTNR